MSAQPLSPVRTPPFTPRQRTTPDPDRPTVVEMVEESTLFVDFAAVGGATLPGILLTVPGLLLFILPVVALGVLTAVLALAALLAAVPVFVAWRIARRAWHAHPAPPTRGAPGPRQPAGPELAPRVAQGARTRSTAKPTVS